MKLHVVTTLTGIVVGAYTKSTKALAARETWVRNYNTQAIITEVEVNDDAPQDESGAD